MKPTHYSDKTIVMDEIRDDNKFIIPQFQRNVVWNKKKREAFIRNLLDGEPFGIILIREKNGKYELIDGLQRISTIKDFYQNPFEYLTPADIDLESVDKLIEANLTSKKYPVTKEYIEEKHEEWRKKIFDSIKEGGKEASSIDVISDLTELDLSTDKGVWKIVDEIFNDFKNSINLDTLQIMAINYIGPEENIPNVFYNLNTGGVQLSKYETYAALWYQNKFNIEDEEIIDIVADKYTQLEERSELDVDFNKETLKEEGITLFEYCYALGVIMRKDNFNILFGKNTKSTDPTGFEILALLLTDKVNNATGMYDLLKDVSPDFLVELKNTIKQSLVQITEALKDQLLDGMNHSPLYSENTYLTYHMIVSYIKEYYVIDYKNGIIEEQSSNLSKGDFEKYAHIHYFYDCITDFWKENRQVSDLQKEVVDEKRRQKYWYNITPQEWEEATDKFMESQKSIGAKITQKNKIFIDFLTRMKIQENPEYKKCFTEKNVRNKEFPLDIEHIMPKKVIQDHIVDLSDSEKQLIPVSAVGNLCYLTARDNRAKGHKTLYDFLEGRPAFYEHPQFLKCVNYPSKNDLKFKDYNNEKFLEEYYIFIDKRQKVLQEEFLRLVNVLY